jgi:hypothetical protein
MNNMDWIKDLVISEQRMEDSGVVDLTTEDQNRLLEEQTLDFLRDVKTGMIEAASVFNQFKGSNLGAIKIYGISNTKADFMLFRNGYKLIFSMKRPGEVEIYFSLIGAQFLNTPTNEADFIPSQERDVLRSSWGAFGELNWAYRGHAVKLDFLVRHYFSRFIRESTK